MSLFGKKHILLTVATMLCAIGLCGCSGQAEEDTEAVVVQVAVNDSNPLVAEQLTKVTYGDVIKRDLYDGVVTPYVEELYFNNEGIFLEYRVAVGETVKKGQTIAYTDTTAMKEQVEKLEEQIANLTNQYNYQLAVLKNTEATIQAEMDINYFYLGINTYPSESYTYYCKLLGKQDRTLKANQLEQKQLTETYQLELPYLTEQLEQLKKQLNKNVIKAPFDGVVVQLRNVAGGDKVNTEDPYVAIADTSRYIVVGDYVGSSVIDKAEGVYAFINGKQYEVTYLPMDKELYSKVMAGNGKAYSTYEIAADGRFDFGQTVKLSIVRESKQDVLVVANVAVRQESARRYCYVKRGNDREKVYIETGLNDGMYYEVKSGLAEGDEVFIE